MYKSSFVQVQFVLVMVHAFQLLFKNDCNYPIYFAYFIGAHAVLFYFLFSQFYKQAYTQKQKVGVVVLSIIMYIDIGHRNRKAHSSIYNTDLKSKALLAQTNAAKVFY